MSGCRKPWVGGNFKSNGTVHGLKELCGTFNNSSHCPQTTDVVIFPVSLHYAIVKECLNQDKYHVGLQNVSVTGTGAYTGEIAAPIAKDIGVLWTLVGHSERRQLYCECDETVAKKTAAALAAGLNPAICIGETLAQREANETDKVLTKQVEAIIPSVTDWKRTVIAYEPVWAIGTGVVATPEQAQQAHETIRKLVSQKVSPEVADSLRIVYGGSVNGTNCKDLARCPDIDGFLVGGASLKPEFCTIIESVTKGLI